MKRRWPLILIGLAGVFLWQGGAGLVAIEHTIVWKVPSPSATVRKVEGQLWQGDELLTRFELETPNGVTLDPERKLTLPRGAYRSELLVWREGATEPEVKRSAVDVGSDVVIVVR